MARENDTRGLHLPYLEACRVRRVLSQKQLAEASGVSRGTISAAECGARVRFQSIQKLARALGVDASALVEGMPDQPGRALLAAGACHD